MTTPNLIIPRNYGLCECGCGEQTRISTLNYTHNERAKGNPRRFITGHQFRKYPPGGEVGIFKIDGVYCRLIPLTLGLWAIVWESHYDWLMQWKWMAYWNRKSHKFYATRANGSATASTSKTIWMHRAILGLRSGLVITGDHENGNSLDNRQSNLRPANKFQQSYNRKRMANNTSGYKGVSFHKKTGKWAATITAKGKHYWLGLFDTPELAYAAYCEAAIRLHGEFARLA